jgi:hypothetical protein
MVSVSCPSCAAAVTFQSAVSVLAVCEYCRSTIIRQDLKIEDIGKMAQLKLDGSPLQLTAEGVYEGVHFAIIGRIQLQYDRGVWNEWHLLFDDARSGWLGEAQGIYVVTFLESVPDNLPGFDSLKPGRRVQLKTQVFEVTNVDRARCIAGEGELPFVVGAGYEAPVVDLQSSNFAAATLDYSDDAAKPLVFIGRYVDFDALKLRGLRQFDGW